jgi:hypothetical protein
MIVLDPVRVLSDREKFCMLEDELMLVLQVPQGGHPLLFGFP